MRGAFPTGWRTESLARSVPPSFAGREDPPRTPPRRRFAPRRRTRDFLHSLLIPFGGTPVVRDRPLAPLTTLGLGGPAEWFLEANREDAILSALAGARGLPVTVLGGGSNLLVADRGVRGLVIRIRGGTARRLDEGTIRVAAGMSLNGLVRWTIQRGLAGLESWAGTPGAVGGAIHGNAHFGGREIGEIVSGLRLARPDGEVEEAGAGALRLAPGGGALGKRGLVFLSADFAVTPGDPAILRRAARASLAFRKRTQPLGRPSAGCAFRNPDPARAPLPPGVPASAGALLDRAGLKGRAVGRARVSDLHANFLIADPGATATDLRRLLEVCRAEVEARFGVELVPEIIFAGDFGEEPDSAPGTARSPGGATAGRGVFPRRGRRARRGAAASCGS